MFASFEYTLSRDEYANGLKVAALTIAAQDRRRAWWFVAYLIVVGSAVAIASVLRPGSFDGIVTALAIVAIGFCTIQTRWARNWREISFEPDNATRRVIFDAEGVLEQQASAEGRWSWDGVRRVFDQPDAVMVQVSGWHLITLPNRLWSAPDLRAEFIVQVRGRATNLLPDIKSYALRARAGSTFLTIGAVAVGLDVIILRDWLLYLAGVDLCSCAVRRSLAGQLAHVVTFVAAIMAIVVSKLVLERLRNSRPVLAKGSAALSIFLFSAVLLWGLVLRLH